jgi:hypothetical protein
MDRPAGSGRLSQSAASRYAGEHMSPTWIWMQVAIVVFVLAGMIVAVTKLA